MANPRKKQDGSRTEIKRKVLDAFREYPNHAFNYKRIVKRQNIKKEAIKKYYEMEEFFSNSFY